MKVTKVRGQDALLLDGHLELELRMGWDKLVYVNVGEYWESLPVLSFAAAVRYLKNNPSMSEFLHDSYMGVA